MLTYDTHSLIQCGMCSGDVGPDMSHWEDMLLTPTDAPDFGRESRRVNLTDCEELEAAIDEFCTFDDGAVRDFTADVKKNGGEFSIGFWVKPLGDESLMSADKFFPHVRVGVGAGAGAGAGAGVGVGVGVGACVRAYVCVCVRMSSSE